MKLGKKVFIFFTVFFVLVTLLSICLGVMLDNANQLTQMQMRRFESHKLADELRRSSDDLTRMARTYTVTSDVRFKRYFQIIADIRDGKEARPRHYQNIFWDFITANHEYVPSTARKVSIVRLMQELDFTDEELSVLAEAKARSDNLIKMEVQAFNAMEGRFTGSDGMYSVTGKPDQALARRIVHGEAYHLAKSDIMKRVNEFFRLLELRTLNEVVALEATQKKAYFFAVGLVLMLVLFSVYSYYFFNKNIIFPLNDLRKKVKQMKEGTYKFKVNERNDEIGLLMQDFSEMANTISRTINELEKFSRTDQLTKINNRIGLNEILDNENYKFGRYQTSCSLILLDIDNFKNVNDQYGHVVGDDFIIKISALLSDNVRESDIVGRWGGEEFLIICPDTSLQKAGVLAESIRKKINNFSFLDIGHRSASFGVSTFKDGYDIVAVIDEADKALYRAKDKGRNKVCIAA